LDNKSEDGGFIIVPGSHKFMKEWSKYTYDSIGINYGKNSNFIMFHCEKDGVVI
jgi:hypothetical protein